MATFAPILAAGRRRRTLSPPCLLLFAALVSCSDGPTAAGAPSLTGTWAEVTTSFPAVRAGRHRCFVFREDSTYIQEDLLPSDSAVPLVLERWEGRFGVVRDTLTRSMDRDRLFSGYSGVLTPYWDYSDQGSVTTALNLRGDVMRVSYDLWVQDSGFVAVLDRYHRAPEGTCGAISLP